MPAPRLLTGPCQDGRRILLLMTSGTRVRAEERQVGATTYASTTSILRALDQAEAAGATVLMPRTPLPGGRVLAYYRTAEGQVVGLLEEPI